MPKINEPISSYIVVRANTSQEAANGKKPNLFALKGTQPHIEDSLEIRPGSTDRKATEKSRLTRSEVRAPIKQNSAKVLSEKPTPRANPAETAYRSGLPLVYRTDAKIHGELLVVLYGQHNRKAAIVDLKPWNKGGSNNLAFEMLVDQDGPEQSRGSWNTKRVIIAAMFHAGILVDRDTGMARHMMRKMPESERNAGLNKALQYCVGQDLPLMRAILGLGAKPNEVFFDD